MPVHDDGVVVERVVGRRSSFELEQRLPRRHVFVVALLVLPLGVDDLRLPGLMANAATFQEKSFLATIFRSFLTTILIPLSYLLY